MDAETPILTSPAQVFRDTLTARRKTRSLPVDTRPWDTLTEEDRADLEVSVQAAVDAKVAAMVRAADGGTVVIAFRDPLTPQQGEELHDRWAEYGPETVSLVIADGVAAVAAQQPQPAPESPMLPLYREALERLADEDTPVLGEGLGGGAQEELHVRASFAAHTLGRDTCGCTECMVSLGLDFGEPDNRDGHASPEKERGK